MYSEFYGLESLAFQLMPDARFFFDSEQHRKAMAHLNFGLQHAEGFIVITGEVGAGKTMLVDHLLSQIDSSSFVVAKIVTTFLGGDDLLRMVAAAFGLEHENLSKASLLARIQRFLIGQNREGRRALLIVDEAQNLTLEALEELRMLSNIVVGTASALQSFLLGQPQFRAILADPALDQLRQRVTTAYHLGALSESDTRAYIEHRLHRAGWKGDPKISEDCFPLIFRYTAGVPRQINTLCTRLLLYGFLESSHAISGTDAEQVATDLAAEIAAVTSGGLSPPSNAEKTEPPPTGLTERLIGVEHATARHAQALRRMIEIMIQPLQVDEVHDP
jgi:general secretion pathway protein A